MVGEIHLANIFFTNGSAAKVRPVLLLKANSFNDVIFLPLTSNRQTKGVLIDNGDLEEGYLPKESVVIYEKPGVIASNLLIKKIGVLQADKCRQILNELVHFIRATIPPLPPKNINDLTVA